MKIASFNINGIKARLLLLREWLEREKPDVIGLQELKADNNKLEKNIYHCYKKSCILRTYYIHIMLKYIFHKKGSISNILLSKKTLF